MEPARASPEGTAAYARRFGAHLTAGYRRAFGLTLSSLGLGTYLGRGDEAADRAYAEAVVAAVQGGVNLIDTAVNYRLQRSERAIGHALERLAGLGFQRGELVVATKGGYVPAADPEEYFAREIVANGLASSEELVAGCHCLAPGYLRHQLETSLGNLGLRAVDIYYLHNPEQQLDEIPRPEFLRRLRAAFEALEQAAADGRIGVYGTATWNGFRAPAGSAGGLSLEDLVRLAREVAGEAHRFRVVQLPFNLAMPEAYGAATQRVEGERLPLLEAARRLDVAVIASASILQGRLARGLPQPVRELFPGMGSDALRAIQFARSAPGVAAALVGMGRAEHVRENLAVLETPPLAAAEFAALFSSGH